MPISADTVERALAIAGRSPENYAYFFERLSSPDWIKPLDERGLFAEPPPLEEEDGYVRAPNWPVSAYLARVADEAAEQVLAIALAIETDNERVHQDLAEAAMAMPGPLAAKWAAHELLWVTGRDRLFFSLPDKLVDLATHLAANGEVGTALALVAELFRPVGVDRSDQRDRSHEGPDPDRLLALPNLARQSHADAIDASGTRDAARCRRSSSRNARSPSKTTKTRSRTTRTSGAPGSPTRPQAIAHPSKHSCRSYAILRSARATSGSLTTERWPSCYLLNRRRCSGGLRCSPSPPAQSLNVRCSLRSS